MRDLYERVLVGGEAALAELVRDRQQEHVSSEFKMKADSSDGIPTRDDRRNLGIALSAFANSMGGMIVWGVQAAKDADGVDCATVLKPINGSNGSRPK